MSSPAPSSRRFDRVAVIVPAHDERTLLPACLRSLCRASAASPVPVEVIVVADACTDGTDLAAHRAALDGASPLSVVVVQLRNVGAARAAGVAAALQHAGPHGLWLASTDADTVVPAHWLAGQLAHAERGADLVLGTVRARDWTGWPPGLATEYQRRYDSVLSAGGHPHVHGANLGVSATRYLAVGGFPPLAAHEDVALATAVRRSGGQIVTALDLPVCTSTRRVTRAPAGFGVHLSRIAAELGLGPPVTGALA